MSTRSMKLAAVILLIAGSITYGDSTIPMVKDFSASPPANMRGSNLSYGTSGIPVSYTIPGTGSVTGYGIIAGSVFGKIIFKPTGPITSSYLKNRLFLGSISLDKNNNIQGFFNGNMGNVIEMPQFCGDCNTFSIAFANLKEDKDNKDIITGKAYTCSCDGIDNTIRIYNVTSKRIDNSPGSPIQLSLNYSTCQAFYGATLSEVASGIYARSITRLSTLNMNDYRTGDGDSPTVFEDQLVVEYVSNNKWGCSHGFHMTDSIAIAHIDPTSGLLDNNIVPYRVPLSRYPDGDLHCMQKPNPDEFGVITTGYLIGTDADGNLSILFPYVYGTYGSGHSAEVNGIVRTLCIPLALNKDGHSVDLSFPVRVATTLSAEYSSTNFDRAHNRMEIMLNSGFLPFSSDAKYWQYVPQLAHNAEWGWDTYTWTEGEFMFTYENANTDNASYEYKTTLNPLSPPPPSLLQGSNPDISVDMTGAGPYDIKNNANDLASDINQAKESFYEQGYRVLAVVYGQPFFSYFAGSSQVFNAFPLFDFNTGTVTTSSISNKMGSGFSYTGEHGINSMSLGGLLNDRFMVTSLVSNENSYSTDWQKSQQVFDYAKLEFRYDENRYPHPGDYYRSGAVLYTKNVPKVYTIKFARPINCHDTNLTIKSDVVDKFRLGCGNSDMVSDKGAIESVNFNMLNPNCYQGASDDTDRSKINVLSYGLKALKYSSMLNEDVDTPFTDPQKMSKHIAEICKYYSGDPQKGIEGTCESFNQLEDLSGITNSGIKFVISGEGKTVGGSGVYLRDIGESFMTGYSQTESWNNALGVHAKLNFLAYSDNTTKWTNFGSTETSMQTAKSAEMAIQIPNGFSDLYKLAGIYNLRSNFKMYYIDVPMLKSYLYGTLGKGETFIKKPPFISDYCWETNNSHYLIFPYMLDWYHATNP